MYMYIYDIFHLELYINMTGCAHTKTIEFEYISKAVRKEKAHEGPKRAH